MKQIDQQRGFKIGAYTTSSIEIIDLAKSWIAIAIAFAILQHGLKAGFMSAMLFSAITVGIAFIAHELAHKIAAQQYGCFAEFRAFDTMLFLAILMSFFGFIFFAPGAVMISGPVGKKRNGIIAAAGPATNFALAIIFLILLMYTQGMPILTTFFTFGALINAWLGLFNMIPVWLFDGKKILAWSKPMYFAMLATGIILLLLALW